MTARDQLFALQLNQLRHDELYHRDILHLSVADRMKHFALHFSKYIGKMVESVLADDSQTFSQAIIDSFIIVLTSANTLEFDIGERSIAGRSPPPSDIRSLGKELTLEVQEPIDDRFWSIARLAVHCGHLAKACESLDHIEDFPFRESMKTGILGILQIVLVEAESKQIDLQSRVLSRLAHVESKHIFYGKR